RFGRATTRLPLRAALPLRGGGLPQRLRPGHQGRSPLGLPPRRRGRASPHRRTGPRYMATLVELRGVVKHFPVSRSLCEIATGQRPVVRALEGVSFDIGAGEPIAIVGESGCGKTTLGRLLLKLVEPTAGSIAFDGAALAGLAGQPLRDFRRQ